MYTFGVQFGDHMMPDLPHMMPELPTDGKENCLGCYEVVMGTPNEVLSVCTGEVLSTDLRTGSYSLDGDSNFLAGRDIRVGARDS